MFSLKLEKTIDLAKTKQPVCPGKFLVLPEGFLISDELNHRLVRVSACGEVLQIIGQAGRQAGQLLYPKGLAADARGNIYVADSANHRLQLFSSAGQPLPEFKGQGWQLNEPTDVLVLADGQLLVVDSGNQRVVKLSPQGELVAQFGARSSWAEEQAFRLSCLTRPELKSQTYLTEPHWEFPQTITTDAAGNLIITDPHNQRLVMTSSQGRLISYLPLPAEIWPQGIFCAAGYIWLVDSNTHALALLNGEGVYLNRWEEWQLRFPQCLVLQDETLYVSDSFKQRILVFRPTLPAPRQIYDSLINQPATPPLTWQKYALYLEKTAQQTAAKDIYQKLVTKYPDYLVGHYHYLNFLRANADEELAGEIAVFVPKVIAASRKLFAELAECYQKACQVNQQLVETKAAYEEETLGSGAAADALVSRQEILTRESRLAETALRETGVQISDQWQFLVKVAQRGGGSPMANSHEIMETLFRYLQEILAAWVSSSQQRFNNELGQWEDKFSRQGSKLSWRELYLTKQQLPLNRSVSAAFAETTLAILEVFLVSLHAGQTVPVSLSWPALLDNFSQLTLFWPEQPQKLEPLLSKLSLLGELLALPVDYAAATPQNMAILIRELDYPPAPEHSVLLNWFFLGKLNIADQITIDTENFCELAKAKQQLEQLLEKWQGRLLHNFNHREEGLKQSAILSNSLKNIKKENKRELILAQQQFALNQWALNIAQIFSAQARSRTQQLYNLSEALEIASAEFLLTISPETRTELLAKLSQSEETTWETTTARQLRYLADKREKILDELVKWEYVSEEEVEKGGYTRPGTKIYLECLQTINNQLINKPICFLQELLNRKNQLEWSFLKRLLARQADERLISKCETALLNGMQKLTSLQQQKTNHLKRLAQTFEANASGEAILSRKKLQYLLEAEQAEITTLQRQWNLLLSDLQPLWENIYPAGPRQTRFLDSVCLVILTSDTTYSDFFALKMILPSVVTEELTARLLLNSLARQEAPIKHPAAGLLNDLKAAFQTKAEQPEVILERLLTLSRFILAQEQAIFQRTLLNEKLFAQLMGLLEVEFNPLFNLKSAKDLAIRKQMLSWQWSIGCQEIWESQKLTFFLWYHCFERMAVFLEKTTLALVNKLQEELSALGKSLAPVINQNKADYQEAKKRFMWLVLNHKIENFATQRYLETYKYLNMKKIVSDDNQQILFYNWLNNQLCFLRETPAGKPANQLKLFTFKQDVSRKSPADRLELVLRFGGRGESPGKMMGAFNMAITPQGYLYVTDVLRNCVHKFNTAGEFILSFGKTGKEPGQFNSPWGIACSLDNFLYVTDHHNHRIQVFDENGNFLKIISRLGNAPNELHYPTGIQVDKRGNIFVAEKNNHRAQIFNPAGQSLGVFWANDLLSAHGLALREDGEIYVCDYLAGKIWRGNVEYQNNLPVISALSVYDKLADPLFVAADKDALYISGSTGCPLIKYPLAEQAPSYNLFGFANHFFERVNGLFLSEENGKKYLYFIEKMSIIIYKFEIN